MNPGTLHTQPVVPGVQEVYSIILPSMTTAERDNLVQVNGLIIYNTTTATVQVRQNGVWASV